MAQFEVRPVYEEQMTMSAIAKDATGEYQLVWGDGHIDYEVRPGEQQVHTFSKPGRYTAYGKYESEELAFATAQFQINASQEPNVDIKVDPKNNRRVILTFTDDGLDDIVSASRYTIYWDDGTDPVKTSGIPGQTLDHKYKPGTYDILVVEEYSFYAKRFEFTVPEWVPDPGFTLTADGMTATLTVTGVPSAQAGDKLKISWHDVTNDSDEIDAVVGTTVTHTYRYPRRYLVLASYTSEPRRAHMVGIDIPPKAAES